MAKATAVKKQTIEKVTLELTVQEAADLHHTLGQIGGRPQGTVRLSLDDIYHAISRVGRLDVQARTLSGLSLASDSCPSEG